MGELTLLGKFKKWVAGIAFKVMLWGNDMTCETYWKLIYEQEKLRKKDAR